MIFLGKSFPVRVNEPDARVCECIFARFSQGKHAFSTSAASSLPSGKDKYPRSGPFRRPSSRDKTNFSVLTSSWESREPDGNFWGMVGGLNNKSLMIYTVFTSVSHSGNKHVKIFIKTNETMYRLRCAGNVNNSVTRYRLKKS